MRRLLFQGLTPIEQIFFIICFISKKVRQFVLLVVWRSILLDTILIQFNFTCFINICFYKNIRETLMMILIVAVDDYSKFDFHNHYLTDEQKSTWDFIRKK